MLGTLPRRVASVGHRSTNFLGGGAARFCGLVLGGGMAGGLVGFCYMRTRRCGEGEMGNSPFAPRALCSSVELGLHILPTPEEEGGGGVGGGRLSAKTIRELERIRSLPTEHAVLTAAPNVPPPIERNHPALVKVSLRTTVKKIQLTNQHKYEAWTFNDLVPGPMFRVREGDYVELTLTNEDPIGNPHNIDCHAFEGQGGGANITTAESGQTKTAIFKALYPGLFLYHCAAAPIPVHIMNGMYGMMLVEPDGARNHRLPKVDREFYVMQSEFYHEPPEREDNGRMSDTVEYSYPNALREEPQAVVFNGREGALTRDAPMKASTGESVRIYFGNAGPNLTSSFHVIGSIFNRLYRDADLVSKPARYVQTTSVPPGGACVVDMDMIVPGTYALTDHAIFRLDKGAVGFLNVSGPPRPDITVGLQDPAPCVGCKIHP